MEPIKNIPLNQIIVNDSDNVRHKTDGISELAESIRTSGLLQNLVVRETADGYRLVAGFRRYYALRIVHEDNLSVQIPCKVLNVNETKAKLLTLVENTARRELNTYELAKTVHDLQQTFDSSIAAIHRYLASSSPGGSFYSSSHLAALVNTYNRLHPDIALDWKTNKLAMSVSAIIELAKRDQTDQWALYSAHKSGEPAEKSVSRRVARKRERPTLAMVEKALQSAKQREAPVGVIEALRWVAGSAGVLKVNGITYYPTDLL